MSFNKYRLKGAYHYEWYETEEWYKWLVDRCVSFCKGSTIDVGCGDGLLSHKIGQKHMTDVLGVDKDVDGLKLAIASTTHASFQQFDVDKYQTHPNHPKYEYLVCLNVIEHLEKPERLKKMIKDIATKGAIIITIDWQGGAFGEDHKKEYTLPELVEFFKEFNPKPFRYKDTEWIGVQITK